MSQKITEPESENLTGFIVKVTSHSSMPVHYLSGKHVLTLMPGQGVVGYFWQMNGRRVDNTFETSHFTCFEMIEVDKKKYFVELEDLVFQTDDIDVEIIALRGPESYNRHLSEKYQHLETWDRLTIKH